jgi:RimJ/RimL family protein N-acetyltransferase
VNGFALRKVHELDNRLLRRWRNANARYFPPGPEITTPMQSRWYEEYLLKPEDHQYMVLHYGAPVGTLAIDIRDRMFNRVMRGRPDGKGAMGWAMFKLMALYGAGTYSLQVLEGNDKAINFYSALGFRVFGRQPIDFKDPESPVMVGMMTEYNL